MDQCTSLGVAVVGATNAGCVADVGASFVAAPSLAGVQADDKHAAKTIAAHEAPRVRRRSIVRRYATDRSS
jgi:hypothetical protein